jgi:hypothetical protein
MGKENVMIGFNTKIFNFLYINHFIVDGLNALHQISCPEAYQYSLNYFIEKRDATDAPHIKKYWNNKISSLFWEASTLFSKMDLNDEKYLNITKKEIKDVLDMKSKQYNIKYYLNSQKNK